MKLHYSNKNIPQKKMGGRVRNKIEHRRQKTDEESTQEECTMQGKKTIHITHECLVKKRVY